jgi:hypothetical protein
MVANPFARSVQGNAGAANDGSIIGGVNTYYRRVIVSNIM